MTGNVAQCVGLNWKQYITKCMIGPLNRSSA